MLYTRGEKHKIALLPKILCFEYITKFRNLRERLVRSHPSQGETFSSDSCQEWCLARRSPKMSLFEFQAGRPNCNPLLPQLSPLQASKICKLIPFLTKGDYLSRRSSSRVQHGCKCGHPFIFVFLCFLVVCIFAIIVQVAGGSAATAFLKSNILGKHCYKMKHLEKMHYSLPTFCYKFKCTLAWKKYTTASSGGNSTLLCCISLFYMRSPPRGLYFFLQKSVFFLKPNIRDMSFF